MMEKFDTGAVREEKTGKGRCDLLPMCALIRLSKHFEKGSNDHGERNWEKGIPMHSFIDSALRHLFKYMDGWDDEDHLCSAAWNILCAMWTEEKKPEMQDIPTRINKIHVPSIATTNHKFSIDTLDCPYYKDGHCSGTGEMDLCKELNCKNIHYDPEHNKYVYCLESTYQNIHDIVDGD